MTAQLSDGFRIDAQDFLIAGIRGEGLFDPAHHGFEAVSRDTGCWRGYVCTYAIDEGHCVLADLSINHGRWQGRSYQRLKAPDFGGRTAQARGADDYERFDLNYTNLALPVAFDGNLLVARDFIRELYMHMGFHPAWKFRSVHELAFRQGRLVAQVDASARLAALREKLRQRELQPGPGDRAEIEAWIADCFSLRYDAQ